MKILMFSFNLQKDQSSGLYKLPQILLACRSDQHFVILEQGLGQFEMRKTERPTEVFPCSPRVH